MESLMIAGLAGLAGYYLQDKTFRKTEGITNVDDKETVVLENEKPNSPNIYSGNKVTAVNDDILQMSLQNYKDSQTPSQTGILPPIYNTYSTVGDDTVLNINVPEQNLSKVNDVNRRSNPLATPEIQMSDRPMFKLSQLGTPSTNDFSNFGNSVTEQEISLLTGQPIQREHSNMIPFFGSNVKQNIEKFTNESTLDNYTGNTSTFIHKQEATPRFEQTTQNIYGSPLITDYIDTSRFIPSPYRQNEKPFYEEKVAAPIAGTLDNPLNNVRQPTIDTLRTANNQQVSYAGRTKSGQMGSVRGVNGTVMKNKPDTSFELGQDRFFTSTGTVIASKQPENYQNIQQTSRQDQNIEYYGTAKNTDALAFTQRLQMIDNTDELDFSSLVEHSKRNQLNSDTQRNIGSMVSGVNDYGLDSINLPELERDTTNEQQTLNINKSSSGHQVGLQDEIKQTVKQTTLKQDNSGNIKYMNKDNNTGLTDYEFKTTQKQTLIYNKYKGQANKNDGMGYTVLNPEAKTTNKEITSNNPYSGNANNKNKKSMVYNTFLNPEKVRNAVHAENYKGSGSFHTSATENREQFKNAKIGVTKEKLLQGQRPGGRTSSLGTVPNNYLGKNKLTANMLLKEKANTRKENVSTQSVIPSKSNLGRLKPIHNDIAEIENNRLNLTDVKSQLSNNPFYNLK